MRYSIEFYSPFIPTFELQFLTKMKYHMEILQNHMKRQAIVR